MNLLRVYEVNSNITDQRSAIVAEILPRGLGVHFVKLSLYEFSNKTSWK